MPQPRVRDRRRHPRAQLKSPIVLGTGDSTATLRDISRNGVSFVSATPMSEMTLLSIHLELDHPGLPIGAVDCQGVVVRCDETPDGLWEIGLFFLELSDEDRGMIDRFVTDAASLAAELHDPSRSG